MRGGGVNEHAQCVPRARLDATLFVDRADFFQARRGDVDGRLAEQGQISTIGRPMHVLDRVSALGGHFGKHLERLNVIEEHGI